MGTHIANGADVVKKRAEGLSYMAVLDQLFDAPYEDLFSDLIMSGCRLEGSPKLNCCGVRHANTKYSQRIVVVARNVVW